MKLVTHHSTQSLWVSGRNMRLIQNEGEHPNEWYFCVCVRKISPELTSVPISSTLCVGCLHSIADAWSRSTPRIQTHKPGLPKQSTQNFNHLVMGLDHDTHLNCKETEVLNNEETEWPHLTYNVIPLIKLTLILKSLCSGAKSHFFSLHYVYTLGIQCPLPASNRWMFNNK